MTTKKEFAREIQKQRRQIIQKKRNDFNFLGFIESRDLPDEIIGLFGTYINSSLFYNWVDGNNNFQKALQEMLKRDKITQKEICQIIFN